MGWRDTIKTADSNVPGTKPSWRDTITHGEPEDVPYPASAAAGFEKAVPFSSQIGAAGKTAMDVITGVTPPSDIGDEYSREKAALSEGLGKTAEANPKSALLGSMASAPLMPIPATTGGMATYGGAMGLSDSKAKNLGQALTDAGTGAATGAVIGEAGEQAGKVLSPLTSKVSEYLKNKAYALKEKATGATGRQLEEFRPGTGKYMFENKIGGAFSDPAAIAESSERSMDRSSAEIANMLENKLSGTSVSRADVIKAIDDRIGSFANDESKDKLVTELQRIRNSMAEKAEKNPTVPIAEAERIKRGFQKNVNYKTAAPNINENDANAAAAYDYRQAVEDSAGSRDPELLKKFIADKRNTEMLAPVQKYSEKRANQLQQSPHGGLLDMASIAAGGTVGKALEPILGPLAVPIGAAAGYGAKTLRPRYASMGAHGAHAIANSIPKLGAIAPVVEEAAIRAAKPMLMKDPTSGHVHLVAPEHLEEAFAHGGEPVDDDEAL